ncbi:hypothetical protein AGMMS49983_20190 [Clostridia bacterium]|nr:hypothetical protein AGMMS49983_20190 [Clostridia bacterium]
MKSSDIDRIQHIRSYCEDIATTIARYGADISVFKSDKDYFNSVSMSIFQIGELSLGLSDEFKEETNEQVLWSAMRGMWNYFAHGYASMDKDII